MPNYDSAGVFIEERSAGERSIASVSPSAMGIIGFSLRGRTDVPISFGSYDEFERKCGGYIKTSEAAYQVKAFFDNGGGRGWFSRAIKASSAAKAFYQVATTLGTAATITGDKDHSGGIVVIAGDLTNIKVTIDTIYIIDDLDVTAGSGNGNYALQVICDNINNAFVALFGSKFANVATVAAGSAPGTYALKLTSPTTGTSSDITAASATTNDGLAGIFGTTDTDTGTSASGNTFKVRAQYVGEDGNNISFRIDKNINDFTGFIFDMTVYYNGEVSEFYEAISFNSNDKDLATYYKTQIEKSSQFIEISEEASLPPATLLIPLNGMAPTPLANGQEDISSGATVNPGDLSVALVTALGNFDKVGEILNIICPDAENLESSSCVAVQSTCANYYVSTQRAKDTFAILAPPSSLDDVSVMTDVTDYVKTSLGVTHSYAAFYYPPVKIFDVIRRKDRRTSVTGFVAGVYARTDSVRNVGKAPGGINDGSLLNISSVYRVLAKSERDVLYPGRVNPIASTPETGRAVWGVRTLSLDSEWRYINARRLFIYCERSIWGSMHFATFENNGPRLWLILRTTIGAWLQSKFVDGYFAGATEDDAYYVKCDESNNPQSQIDAGLVTVDVGIAVNKPAEFIRIRFQQKVKGA